MSKFSRLKNLNFHSFTPYPTKKHGTNALEFLNSEYLHQKAKPNRRDQAFRYRDRLAGLCEKLAWHDVYQVARSHAPRSPLTSLEPLNFGRSDRFTALDRPIVSSILTMQFAKFINDGSEEGATLNLLCEEYGPGCFFFLADHLPAHLSVFHFVDQ